MPWNVPEGNDVEELRGLQHPVPPQSTTCGLLEGKPPVPLDHGPPSSKRLPAVSPLLLELLGLAVEPSEPDLALDAMLVVIGPRGHTTVSTVRHVVSPKSCRSGLERRRADCRELVVHDAHLAEGEGWEKVTKPQALVTAHARSGRCGWRVGRRGGPSSRPARTPPPGAPWKSQGSREHGTCGWRRSDGHQGHIRRTRRPSRCQRARS